VAWVARGWSVPAAAHAGALWAALATVGGASLLLAQRTRLPRLAGALLALGGLSLATVHATADARRPGRPSTWASAAAVETARAAVPPDASTLRLSPGAAAFAVQLVPEGEAYADEDAEFPAAGRFAVGRFDDSLHSLHSLRAHDVAFAGDDAIVTLTADSSGATLRLASLAAPDAATWTLRLPALALPRLHVDARTRRWTVLGLDGPRTGVVRHRGVLGDTAVHEERWAERPAGLPLLFAAAPVVLSPRRLPVRGGMIGAMVSMSASRWEAWRVDGAGPTWIGGFPGVPLCGAVLSDDAALCLVGERGGTSIWRVDAQGVTPAGWVPDGAGSAYALTPALLLPGGRALLTVTADGFAVSTPGAARGLRLRVAGGTGEPRAVAAVPAGMALLATRDGVATVTRYATPPAAR